MRKLFILRQEKTQRCFTMNHGMDYTSPCVIAFTDPKKALSFKTLLTDVSEERKKIEVIQVPKANLYQGCAMAGVDIIVYTKKHRMIRVPLTQMGWLQEQPEEDTEDNS